MNRQQIEKYTDNCNLTGIYRGEVVYNDDPKRMGRVKLFVYGVYVYNLKSTPELLPWAEPAMSLFGGNWTNENFKRMTAAEKAALEKAGQSYDYDEKTYFGDKKYDTTKEVGLNQETGWCSVPHVNKKQNVGAQVFCFFEGGDANKPIYFASAQSGDGWISEYPNQHSIKTDNVSVIINEDYDGVRQITENQVSTTTNQTSNSAIFNEYANKKASEFIPEVQLNDEFESYDSDLTNGYIENTGLEYDGNNFGTYNTNVDTLQEKTDQLEQLKKQIASSKPSSLTHTIDEEEISFYETKMPVAEFSWSYSAPGTLTDDDITYYELRISNDSSFSSILKYKCDKNERSLKLNTLHVGTFYIKVQAVFADYGRSDWSSVDTVTIKYKEDVKIEYESEKTTRPTRVNVFVENRKGVAINLRILGDVNMNIDGNVTEVITGDKYETINGSYVQRIRKGFEQTVEGETVIENKEKFVHQILGMRDIKVHKDSNEIYMQTRDVDIQKGLKFNVHESIYLTALNNFKWNVGGNIDVTAVGVGLKTTDAFSINATGGVGISGSNFQCSGGQNIELSAINMITMGCQTFQGTVTLNTSLSTPTLVTTVSSLRKDTTFGQWCNTINGTATEIVTGTKSLAVTGNYTEQINGSHNVTVGGASALNVGGASTFIAGSHIMKPMPPHIHYSFPGPIPTTEPLN